MLQVVENRSAKLAVCFCLSQCGLLFYLPPGAGPERFYHKLNKLKTVVTVVHASSEI
jgi:hypothetical protein